MQYLLFSLAEHCFGMPIEAVARVVPVVEITPVPTAPETIAGIINVQGTMTTVVDLKRRLGLPSRALRVTDHLVVTTAVTRPLALLVDTVHDVVEIEENAIVDPQDVLPEAELLQGVVSIDHQLVLLYDWHRLLSAEQLFHTTATDAFCIDREFDRE